MAIIDKRLLFTDGIPDFDGAIIAANGQMAAGGRPGHRIHHSGSIHTLCEGDGSKLDIPHQHTMITARRGDMPAIGGPCQSMYRALVTIQFLLPCLKKWQQVQQRAFLLYPQWVPDVDLAIFARRSDMPTIS